MERNPQAGSHQWDAYKVWQILLHRNPVQVADPAHSCGRIERERLAEFCGAIADYPDFLQDTLLLIAHAKGIEATLESLDAAMREALGPRLGKLPGSSAPSARR